MTEVVTAHYYVHIISQHVRAAESWFVSMDESLIYEQMKTVVESNLWAVRRPHRRVALTVGNAGKYNRRTIGFRSP